MVTKPPFWAKYFRIFKNGQKKCPKMKIRKYFAQNIQVLYILFLNLLKEKIHFCE
jgi:hypothetical protein